MFEITIKRSTSHFSSSAVVKLLVRLADAIVKPRRPERDFAHLSDHLKRDIGLRS